MTINASPGLSSPTGVVKMHPEAGTAKECGDSAEQNVSTIPTNLIEPSTGTAVKSVLRRTSPSSSPPPHKTPPICPAEVVGCMSACKPFAPDFMVSAPGKVIVFGEHAVVYGKHAMAASISLRSYLLVTALPSSHRSITLNFRDIRLKHTWDIASLPWEEFQQPGRKRYYYDHVTSLDTHLLEAIRPHVENISLDKPKEMRKVHHNSATAFLYLFLSLSSPQAHAAIYTLRSTIPIGAGLGSSASISVCLSAALLLQIRVLSCPYQDQPSDEAELQIERINRWAFVSELCIHGNPSGVDNTVSSGGKAVLFRRGDYSKPPSVCPVFAFPELPLLLVNSKQPRSTAKEVAKVARLRQQFPECVDCILNAIDEITKSANNFIHESCGKLEGARSRLGELFQINHGCLASLGVSHPRLERIRELVDCQGIGWTKLTGAGGGGCAIVLLREDLDSEKLRSFEDTLICEGFERYAATLGGDGIGILCPPVLRNGSDDGSDGIEINQRIFENACGSDGIERLVGVNATSGRDSWKYWKRGRY